MNGLSANTFKKAASNVAQKDQRRAVRCEKPGPSQQLLVHKVSPAQQSAEQQEGQATCLVPSRAKSVADLAPQSAIDARNQDQLQSQGRQPLVSFDLLTCRVLVRRASQQQLNCNTVVCAQ